MAAASSSTSTSAVDAPLEPAFQYLSVVPKYTGSDLSWQQMMGAAGVARENIVMFTACCWAMR
jgi:hypothetical protein